MSERQGNRFEWQNPRVANKILTIEHTKRTEILEQTRSVDDAVFEKRGHRRHWRYHSPKPPPSPDD